MGQFEETFEQTNDCFVWEAMCPDAVDGTLTSAEQRAFDAHVAGCVHCAEELAHAQRGAAWLGMLKGHTPEPPADLMARILAETTGAVQTQQAVSPVFVPVDADNIWTRPRVAPAKPSLWARTLDIFKIEGSSAAFHPRFAMTAAMAFFSVALTMNMLGVRLRDVHSMANLRPSSITRTVADASATATRNFQNLRVVYQLESRVSELRKEELPGHDQDDAPARQHNQPENTPDSNQQQPANKPHGSSELILPGSAAPKYTQI
jgi:hypothetical protein